MTDHIKELHTTIFTGPMGCGKTHLVLDLIEKEYNKHFDYIIIICPTLRWNKTYHGKDWIRNDDKVGLQNLKTGSISELKSYRNCQHAQKHYLSFMISSLMKDLTRGGSLYQNLVISGRHRGHYLWLLTQSYSAIPKTLRRQNKAIFVWHPKQRADLKMIHDENNMLSDHE